MPTAIRLAVLAAVACAASLSSLAALAATTTSVPANHNYDHLAAFAQSANSSQLRISGFSGFRGTGLRGDLKSFRSGARAGVAAEELPDATIIVRGGQSELPPAGEVFSGSQGQSLDEAAAGVRHGTIRSTTAGEIRAGGGTVRPNPELDERVGRVNHQHVDVCLGPGSCPFSDPFKNPVPKSGRFGFPDYPYDRWGP